MKRRLSAHYYKVYKYLHRNKKGKKHCDETRSDIPFPLFIVRTRLAPSDEDGAPSAAWPRRFVVVVDFSCDGIRREPRGRQSPPGKNFAIPPQGSARTSQCLEVRRASASRSNVTNPLLTGGRTGISSGHSTSVAHAVHAASAPSTHVFVFASLSPLLW